MNYGRADPVRVSVLALAAVAVLLAFTIPSISNFQTGNRNAAVPAGLNVAAGLPRHDPNVAAGLPRHDGLGGFVNPKSPIQNPKLVAFYGRLPLSFEANRGQTDPQVKFLSRGRGYTLFLTGNEAVLSLRSGEFTSPQRGGLKPPLQGPSAVSNQRSAMGKGTTSVVPRENHSPLSSRGL